MIKYLSFLALSISLSACSSFNAAPPLSILEHARSVPISVGQAIAFDQRLESSFSPHLSPANLSSLDTPNLHTSSILVLDLLGNPFNHLTFLTPFPLKNPLTYGLSLSSSDAQNVSIQSFMIGASTARVPVSSVTHNASLLRNMALTVRALGGESELQSWASFNGNDLFAKDRHGQLWDVSNAQPLTEDVADDLTQKYMQIAARNSRDPHLAQQLNLAWDEYLNSPRLKAYESPDGTLNATAAQRDFQKALTDRLSSQVLTQYENCWWAYFFTKCAMRDLGTFDTLIAGGAAQKAKDRGLGETVFRAPVVFSGGGGWVDTGLIGCGPASAQSVLFWYWKRGNAFLKDETYDGVNFYDSTVNVDKPIYDTSYLNDFGGFISGVLFDTPEPDNIIPALNKTDGDGYPYMTKLMKGQAFGTGVVVDPYGYRTGLQAFLDRQATLGNIAKATVRSGYVTPTDSLYEWSNYSDTIRSILHDKFLTGEPVVAVYTIPSGHYSVTPGTAHYSPVTYFRVHEGTAWVDTFVRTVDHKGVDINLNTPWDYVHGVFGINGLKV